MSINFCTLTSSSVDSFCGNRRAIVLQNLIDEFRPPRPAGTGASNGGWTQGRPPANYNQVNRPRWEPPEAPRYEPTELDRITVTAEFLSLKGTDTQSVENRLDLVTVTDIHINPTVVDVNIENLKVHANAQPRNK